MQSRRRFIFSLAVIFSINLQRSLAVRNKNIVNVNVVADVQNIELMDGLLVETTGYYSSGDGGGSTYVIKKHSNKNKKYSININEYFCMILVNKNDPVSLKQLGIHADGKNDDTYLLREVLKFSGNYYFSEGTILVSDYIELAPHISLIGAGMFKSKIEYRSVEGNWLFINGRKGDRNFLSGFGYNGRSDYIFKDFSIDLRGDIAKYSRSAMIFGRSSNVIIENVGFINGKNSHRIECNSQSDFHIKNCIFANTLVTDESSHEEINIDFNSEKSFPAFGKWDYSACKNIIISSCFFYNVQSGVGSHSYNFRKHENIVIIDCSFFNISKAAIRFQSFNNSVIEKCRFEHVSGYSVILLDSCWNRMFDNYFSLSSKRLHISKDSLYNIILDE